MRAFTQGDPALTQAVGGLYKEVLATPGGRSGSTFSPAVRAFVSEALKRLDAKA